MKLAKLLEQNDAWQEKTRKEEEARQQWFDRKGAADIVIEILRRLEIRIQADFRDEFMIAPNGKKYYFGQDPKLTGCSTRSTKPLSRRCTCRSRRP